jgi:hypothetical protein
MEIDLTAAEDFLATHGRVLDRRRFERLVHGGDGAAVLAAVDAYRNPDGGYGWGLEPDLRSPESQPGGALHAFEAMTDAAPATTGHAIELCDWLAAASLADGGLPFARPVGDPAGVAPFWAGADSDASSLQITAYVAAAAHRLAAHDAAVASHPWLAQASRVCADAIRALEEGAHALALVAAAQFADATGDEDLLQRLRELVPPDGVVRVAGGTEEEAVRPLDFAAALFGRDVVARDLERLARGQQDDGGWLVDFRSYSPAAELEWRGYMTVRAVSLLRRHGAC